MATSGQVDGLELRRLRARVDGLARRRREALDRVAHLPGSTDHRRLEEMGFELAQVEWRLAELEAAQ
jgi:hypothetical protein